MVDIQSATAEIRRGKKRKKEKRKKPNDKDRATITTGDVNVSYISK